MVLRLLGPILLLATAWAPPLAAQGPSRPEVRPSAVVTPTEDSSSDVAEQEVVYSGPQPGEPLTGFPARIVWGEQEGEEVDLVGQAPRSPWALIFVHEMTRPSVAVVRAIMRYAATRSADGLQTAVVFLTADATETENFLRRARHALPGDVVIAISPDGLEGPGDYGLNRHVSLTILVAREGLVSANFALVQPSLQTDVLPVAEAIVQTLGSGSVPPLERLLREGDRMEPPQRGRSTDDGLDNQIRSLLQPLIRPTAREEDVRTIAAGVERQLAANEVLRARIGDIASRIVQSGKLGNYGTPAAQEFLREWARKYGPPAAVEESSDSPR